MSTTETLTAAQLRTRIAALSQELHADPERKIMRVRGVPVGAGPHRTREVVKAELDAAKAALPAAEAYEQEERAARAERDQVERARRHRTALQRATAAAADAQQAAVDADAARQELEALVADSPVGKLLDALARREVAATALHAALAVLGPVQLHSGRLDDAQASLLAELGPQAHAARCALPEGHPARLRPEPGAPGRFDRLVQHWLNPPARAGW